MSRAFHWILLAILAFTAFSFNVQAQSWPRKGKITADKLTIRARPGVHFESLGTFKRNEVITAVRQQGDWLEVKLPDNIQAWVTVESVADDGEVLQDACPLYCGPGIVFTIFYKVKRGTHLTLIESAAVNWRLVKVPKDATAWISASYAELEPPPTSDAPTVATQQDASTDKTADIPKSQVATPADKAAEDVAKDVAKQAEAKHIAELKKAQEEAAKAIAAAKQAEAQRIADEKAAADAAKAAADAETKRIAEVKKAQEEAAKAIAAAKQAEAKRIADEKAAADAAKAAAVAEAKRIADEKAAADAAKAAADAEAKRIADEKAAADAAKAAAEAKAAEDAKAAAAVIQLPTFRGYIIPLGPNATPEVSHALYEGRDIHHSKPLCFLTSPFIKLDEWTNMPVEVAGSLRTPEKWTLPILRVSRIINK